MRLVIKLILMINVICCLDDLSIYYIILNRYIINVIK